MKGVWQKATLLSSQVLQMNAHITQCALIAFVFTMVTIISVKSVLLEGNSTYYDQFLQGFVIRTFSQHPNSKVKACTEMQIVGIFTNRHALLQITTDHIVNCPA